MGPAGVATGLGIPRPPARLGVSLAASRLIEYPLQIDFHCAERSGCIKLNKRAPGGHHCQQSKSPRAMISSSLDNIVVYIGTGELGTARTFAD